LDFTEKTLESTSIFEGKIIKLRVERVALPDGREGSREIVEHRGAVAMVALDEDGNIILVRQYRKALEQTTLEIPAGTLEDCEDPLACARRELEEEIKMKAAHWEKILDYYSAPGFCNEILHLYLARDLSASFAEADEDEFLEIVKLPLATAYKYIFEGKIVDGKSIIGIQHAFWALRGESR